MKAVFWSVNLPYTHYNIIVPDSPVLYFLPINVMVICLSPLSTRVSESPGKHVGHNMLVPPFNPDKERSLVLSVPLHIGVGISVHMDSFILVQGTSAGITQH